MGNWNKRYAAEKSASGWLPAVEHVVNQYGGDIARGVKDVAHGVGSFVDRMVDPITRRFNGNPEELKKLQESAQNAVSNATNPNSPFHNTSPTHALDAYQNYKDQNTSSNVDWPAVGADIATTVGVGRGYKGLVNRMDKGVSQRGQEAIERGRQQRQNGQD